MRRLCYVKRVADGGVSRKMKREIVKRNQKKVQYNKKKMEVAIKKKTNKQQRI